jgi:hypothetical protein
MKNLIKIILSLIIPVASIAQSNTPCSSPPALPVNTSCVNTSGTTVGATYQTNAANGGTPSCASPGAPDVWYTFVAPASGNVTITTTAGTITDGGMSLYSGNCPNSFTQIACDDDGGTGLMPEITNATLTPGTTYFIRFWEFSSGTGTFSICITENAAVITPANDDCSGAFPVTVNPDELCGSTTAGTVLGATASSQSTTACGGTENDDVWFSFVATSTTHSIDLLNITGSTTDMYHSVWEGTCPTLTLVAGTCSDPNSQTIGTLTIGNTYYIRVNTWSSTAGATSAFDVCVGTPPPITPPGANSSCVAPDPICSGSAINFTSTVTGLDAEDDINPGNNYDCLFTSPDPTWYYLEIASGGNLVIDMSAGSDIDYAIWGPFPDLLTAQANCNSYGLPLDCSYSTSATEQANVTGTVVGEVYVLLVTNYAGTVQTISINDAPSNTATTDCTIVPLPVELTNFDGHKLENEIILSWTTVSELSNDYFIVERSVDGNVWEAIDLVNGNGTTTQTTNYESIDRNFKGGTNYYRLKQFDFNGTIQYSDVIAIVANNDINVSLVPNPAKSNFVLSTSEYFTQVDIINMQGITVESLEFDSIRKTTIDINALSKGVYNVYIQTDKGTKVERLIVM